MTGAGEARRRAAATRPGHIHIGISGWRYAGWRAEFYPAGLAFVALLRRHNIAPVFADAVD